MSALVEILSAQHFHDDVTILREYSDFPVNPSLGQIGVVNGVLYFYTTIMGIATWYPLTNVKSSKVYVQAVENTVWSIDHQFNTDNIGFFVYDDLNRLQIVQPSSITKTNVTFTFTKPIKGKAVLFFDATMEIPAIVDMTADIANLSAKVDQLILNNGGTGGTTPVPLTVEWADVLNKPTVYYQQAIPADQLTPTEVSNIKAGKLANGGSVASVMSRSPVFVFDSTTNPTQTFNFTYLPFFVMIYVQRTLLRPSEYTATDGSTFTINIPLYDGEEVEIITLTQ